tara:strand:- start:18518 stop:18916 length:399 start_codon:yes stop_codon:yes gene_type:complete
MDLKDLTPKSDTIDVTLVHPNTGEELKNPDGSNMTICMYATHSPEYKKVMHSQTNKRIKAASKTNDLTMTSEQLESSTLAVLSNTTKSWDITFDGEKPELTVKKATDIYEQVFWIKAQLEGAVNDSLDFTKA